MSLFKLPLCPTLSLMWLAVFVLGTTALCDDEFALEAVPVIFHDAQQIAKPTGNANPVPNSLAEFSEGIRLANVGTNVYQQSGPIEQPGVPEVPPATNSTSGAAALATSPSHSDLIRPMNSVSLSNSLRNESLDGEALRVPESGATTIAEAARQWMDVSGYRANPRPRRQRQPVCHNPLYFEDPNLERLGLGCGCFTDAISAAKFFGRTPLVPYLMGSNDPHSCVPSLGNNPYRCNYEFHDYIPELNAKGVAYQAAATVGGIYLIP